MPACSLTAQVPLQKPENPVSETVPEPVVYFCPKDNCTEQLIQRIQASSNVSCAFFDLSIPAVIAALEAKKARVVIDNDNVDVALSRLEYRIDDPQQLSHNKFCVFDKWIVWTGSLNPTQDADRNNNNVVVLESQYLALNYQEEFDELWDGVFSGGHRVPHQKILLNGHLIENYFCPEDCGDALSRIIELIRGAKSEISFMTFSTNAVAKI